MARIEVISRLLARRVIDGEACILVCRDKHHGHAYLPGGHVEFDEDAASALVRELMEEAGLRIEVGELAMVCEARFEQQGKSRHEINLIFHVKQPLPEAVESVESQISFEWLAESKLSESFLPRDLGDAIRAGKAEGFLRIDDRPA